MVHTGQRQIVGSSRSPVAASLDAVRWSMLFTSIPTVRAGCHNVAQREQNHSALARFASVAPGQIATRWHRVSCAVRRLWPAHLGAGAS